MIKFVNDVTTKEITCTSRADTPAGYIIWVAPHQIAHSSIMRNFLFAVKASDLIKSID
jgi:hypothetical protein